MKLSAKGLQFLKEAEGCILHVYRDSAGYPTLGVGHLLTPAEKKNGVVNIKGKHIIYSPSITEQEALDLLAQDVVPAENAVNENVKVPLTQSQFDCLCSFVFNAGSGAFASSTLLKVLNQQRYNEVGNIIKKDGKTIYSGELTKWVHAGGKTCSGLIERRHNEIKLWCEQY